MRAGIFAVAISISISLVAVAGNASAATIFEQPWDGSLFPVMESDGGAGGEVLAPFELAMDGERLEQILWWGSSSSNEFTIRLYGSLSDTDGRAVPDIFSPFFELTTIANSTTAGQFTDLFGVDLPSSIFLSAGVTFISIVGTDFVWSLSVNDTAPPYTGTIRNVGGTIVLIPVDLDVAFVLNDAIAPVPEPSTAILLALGLAVLSTHRGGQSHSFESE